MTWWDHQTESIWSQVWGQAISGPLKGKTLALIPATLVPWASWKQAHPHTLFLDYDRAFFFYPQDEPGTAWVIGLSLADHRQAYNFDDVAQIGLLNDVIGSIPIAIYANQESRFVQTFVRQVDEQRLTLELSPDGSALVDLETETTWDITTGFAQTGPLAGEAMPLLPYSSALDWAWVLFYPESSVYGEESQELQALRQSWLED